MAVTDTEVGDVRVEEGFYHYRQYDACELARQRTYEEVWHLLVDGVLPDPTRAETFRAEVATRRPLPLGVDRVVDAVGRRRGGVGGGLGHGVPPSRLAIGA